MESKKVQEMMKTLNSGWVYNEGEQTLSRTVQLFSRDGEKAYRFVQLLGNIAINQAHQPLEVRMKPWNHTVEVTLQTPLLSGISSNDFMMAFTLDGVITNMTRVGAK